ncbi:MAG: cobalt ECF transporter T component CbiQ [Desulfobulbaceae bacterium]|uniref:Cobalt ECF transporter T component CbiQ n=1 Tax=Candidatus Desulfobia pelagia TaxID=2841692 RepID=A0A8J6NBL4_9BACT|nr:cobalt ECF transporter T component CbiQ [Candidatus Desulfobia pelagia]
MIPEYFSYTDSFLHKADPRMKIVSAACVTGVVAFSRSYSTGICGLILALFLIALSRFDTGVVVRRLLAVNFFTAFLWLTLPLTYGGEALTLGFVTVSRQGIAMAALVTLKANCIVLIFLALVSTSPVSSLGHALRKLGVPEKLCLLFLFSYRYVIVIAQEFQRLLRAAKIRGFIPRTNIHTYRTYAYLFAMTLVKSWNRAHRVQQAMVLRGFNGRFYSMYIQHPTAVERVFFGGITLLAVGMALLELRG